MTSSAPRWPRAVLVLLLLASVLPFVGMLPLYAWSDDARRWVIYCSGWNPSQLEAVFWSKHYIGYRPVTAISFALNHALGGFAPSPYRVADLGLHLGAGTALYALASRLYRHPGWALVPTALFLLHPAAAEVVPFLARRSYSLSTALGLCGVWCFLYGVERDLRRFGVLAGGLLCLAVLANELAYVLVPLLPLWVWWARGTELGPSLARSWPALLVLPAVGVRLAVLGQVGGYTHPWLAFVADGVKTGRVVHDPDAWLFIGATLRYVLAPSGFSGESPWHAGGPLGLAAAVLATTCFLTVLWWRHERLPAVLAVWLLGYVLLAAVSQSWFWRQGYVAVVPVALGVGFAAMNARKWMWLPIGMVVFSMLAHSPLWRMRGRLHDDGVRSGGQQVLRQTLTVLENQVGPVYQVLPIDEENARIVGIWLGLLRPDLDWRPVAFGRRAAVRWDGNAVHLEGGAQAAPGFQGPSVDLTATEGQLLVREPDGWTLYPLTGPSEVP